mgnify:CR=1 FL=1
MGSFLFYGADCPGQFVLTRCDQREMMELDRMSTLIMAARHTCNECGRKFSRDAHLRPGPILCYSCFIDRYAFNDYALLDDDPDMRLDDRLRWTYIH